MPCDCALHARLRLPVMLIIHIIHRHSSRRLLHVVPSSLKSLTSAKAAKSSTEAFIVAEKSIVLEWSANWCLIMFNHKALPQSEDFQTARSYCISGVEPVLAKKPRWQPLAQRLSTWKKRTFAACAAGRLWESRQSKEFVETWSCCLVKLVMSCFKSLSQSTSKHSCRKPISKSLQMVHHLIIVHHFTADWTLGQSWSAPICFIKNDDFQHFHVHLGRADFFAEKTWKNGVNGHRWASNRLCVHEVVQKSAGCSHHQIWLMSQWGSLEDSCEHRIPCFWMRAGLQDRPKHEAWSWAM